MAVSVDGQLEWRATLLGSGTAWRTDKLQGWWDLPAQRGANVPLPSRHGSYPGPKLSADRLVTWEFKLGKYVDHVGFKTAVNTLRQITAPTENPDEEALLVQVDGVALRVMARVLRRAIPTDKHYAAGYTQGAIVWEATDPRLYSADEVTVTIVLAVASPGGLDFGSSGLDFGSGGLDFGAGPQGGSGICTNLGHVDTWPTLEIVGPVTGPVVTWPSGRRLLFDPAWSVLSGQTLVVDTQLKTAEISGVSVSQRLFVREWEPLHPGDNLLRYSAAAYDPTTQLRVRFRHAYH